MILQLPYVAVFQNLQINDMIISFKQMYELLHMWREQEAGLATKNRLKRCLDESGFSELTPLLNQY